MRIHHVAIITRNREVAKRFYVGVLGFKVRDENLQPRGTWKVDIDIPGGGQIELFEFPAAPDRIDRPEAAGLRHLAFAVESAAQWHERVTGAGYPCESLRTDPYTGGTFFFTRDPDGLPVEFYEDARKPLG